MILLVTLLQVSVGSHDSRSFKSFSFSTADVLRRTNELFTLTVDISQLSCAFDLFVVFSSTTHSSEFHFAFCLRGLRRFSFIIYWPRCTRRIYHVFYVFHNRRLKYQNKIMSMIVFEKPIFWCVNYLHCSPHTIHIHPVSSATNINIQQLITVVKVS